MAKYAGSGVIAATDYKAVKWVGKTKSGAAVTIEFAKALNMGNIDWTFAEKDDVVPEIVMTAVYTNTDAALADTTEPWTVTIGSVTAGAGEILLGAGVFYVGGTAVALTRGGGSFTVERTFREINADGDMGPVEGRVELTDSRATLTMNVLTMLTRVTDLYAGIKTVTTGQ